MKKYLYIIFVLISLCTIYGCGETQKFSTRDFSIKVSSDYIKFKKDSFELYIEDDNSFVAVSKETKDEVNSSIIYNFDTITLEQYIQLYCSNNYIGETDILYNDNIAYIEYTLTKSSTSYYVQIYFIKSKSSFWACQFCCYENVKEEYSLKFKEWSKTIDV